jgi:hypothetical protein
MRTDRFCELVKSELNSRLLPSPSLDKPPIIQVQQLEKIECVSCSLDAPSNGSGTVVVGGNLAFKYHATLAAVRDAGSLQPSATAETVLPYKVKFTIGLQPPRSSVQRLPQGAHLRRQRGVSAEHPPRPRRAEGSDRGQVVGRLHPNRYEPRRSN